jgi:hypothetical protein
MKPVYGQKLYYYDERNDDFTDFKAELVRPVDKTYRYENRNPVARFFAFLLYYVIAVPVLWLLCKLFYGVKVEGKRKLRRLKGGCVIYSNHVLALDCAFSIVMVAAPRRCCIVCNPDAVHMPVVRHIVRMLGALPVPDDVGAFKNFSRTVDDKLKKGGTLVVMPEAHIWPYYTGIRDFPATSFTYAAKNGVPAVPVCVTFRKPKGPFKKFMRPRVTVKVGDPVYAEKGMPIKRAAKALRDETYSFMKSAACGNEAVFYSYVKTGEKVETRTQIAQLKRAAKLRRKAKKRLIRFGRETFGKINVRECPPYFSAADNPLLQDEEGLVYQCEYVKKD